MSMDRNKRTLDDELKDLDEFFDTIRKNHGCKKDIEDYINDCTYICVAIWMSNRSKAILPFVSLYIAMKTLHEKKDYNDEAIGYVLASCDKVVDKIDKRIDEEIKKHGNS